MSEFTEKEGAPPLQTIEFGQQQPIHVAIRNLIHDYPRDEGILKELIQNADDGGATDVRFVLDLSDRGNIAGPVAAWSEFGAPSILAINNAPFTERDLQRIQQLGDSGKVESPSETGKYGRGFNAVYNISDTPLLLTGDFVGFFDPCGWFAEGDQKGKGWVTDEVFIKGYPDALSLFQTGKFDPYEERHSTSAFRFPLRSRLRGNSHRDRISDELFETTEFEQLVRGLTSLAEHLVLFLRNVRFIGCYVALDAESTPETLLEITTVNEDEVSAGRGKVNEILSAGKVAEVLAEISTSEDGCIESIYTHEIRISTREKTSQSKWMVCSGLFGGVDGRLVSHAHKLNESYNRAIPAAGAAVCLERDGEAFPVLEGTVSCFLPLSGVLGGAHLPFHLNGAFDLDGSRTGITRSHEGQSGIAKDRAEWNQLLIEDAIAPAVSALLMACRDSTPGSGHLYRLFPNPTQEFAAPFGQFCEAVYGHLAELELFGIPGENWTRAADLRRIQSDSELQRCLCVEGLPIPEPHLPQSVQAGLILVDAFPEQLSLEEVRAHFCIDESGPWILEECPFEGLRDQKLVEALARFLVSFGPETQWEGLPLALCRDGLLRAFAAEGDEPFFIANEAMAGIFSKFPEWFLDAEFVFQSRLPESGSQGFRSMTPVDFVERLAFITGTSDDGPVSWSPNGEAAPNREWLVEVLTQINEFSSDDVEIDAALRNTVLVPGDDGSLHRAGNANTPLLVQLAQQPLVEVLRLTSISHWILNPQDPLTKPLNRFREVFNALWPLTQWDLIDSLDAKKELLSEEDALWKADAVVTRLLTFLQDEIKNEEFNAERIEKLRGLPVFKDSAGRFGPTDDTTYFAGAIEVPEVDVPFRLLLEGGHGTLLRAIGVSEITRPRLLEECILPHVEKLDDQSLVGVMSWVRDEWNHLVHEFGSESDLVAQMVRVACLISTDGKRNAPDALYHPNAQHVVRNLLGDEAQFPDPTSYGQDRQLWMRFFEQLGLATSPQPQDLVDFIEGVIGHVYNGESPTLNQERSLTEILRHVTECWHHLADQTVQSEEHGECKFHEFLADSDWIVPARIESKFFEPRVVEDRLYSPEELLSATQVPRAGSVRCFFPRSIRDFSPEIREKLRVDRIPSARDICAHLRNIVSFLGDRPIGGDQLDDVRKLVAGIYRGLGEHSQAAGESGDSGTMAELQAICAPLSDVFCLFVTSERRFLRPGDVYRSKHQRLNPLKWFYSSADALVESGLDLLGRREEPTIEDLADTLVELGSQDRQLSKPELDAVVASLKIIQLKCEEQGVPTDRVEVRVPNASGFLVDPGEVIFEDDPGLASQLPLDAQLVLHSGAPFETGIYSVARLSRATAKPAGTLSDSSDPAFVQVCRRLEETIQSLEFAEGICRMLQQEGTFFNLPHLHWLSRARVAPLESVKCRFVIELGSGRDLDLGTATVDVAYDQGLGEGGTFLVAESASEVLHNRFADELARELDYPLKNRAPLVAILSQFADQIHRILDRLGIARLRDNDFVEQLEDHEPELDTVPEEEEETDANMEEVHSETPQVEQEVEDDPATDDEEVDSDQNIDSEEDLEDDDSDDEEEESEDTENEDKDADPSRDARRSGAEQGQSTSRHTGNSPSGQETRRGTSPGQSGSVGDDDDDDGDTSETRRRGGGSSGPRGRMERGGRSSGANHGGEKARPKRNAQSDFWISRPKTKQQEEQSKQRNDEGDDEAPRNHSIGEAAVGWVLQYERQQGRKPQNMAHANPGYDIESRKGRIVERYIEVKGIDGEWGQNGVPLSSIQFFKFQDRTDPSDPDSPAIGDRFWLYVVEHARDPEKVTIHTIRDPAGKSTEFRFDHGWKAAGETAEDFQPVFPSVGMCIRDSETGDEGVITRLDPNDYLMVKFETGPAKTVIYRSCDYELIPSSER